MTARVITSTCIVVAITLVSPIAFADRFILNFEDLPANGTGEGPVVFVSRQYQNRGILFNNAVAYDYSKLNAIPGFAHSGTKAIEPCMPGTIEEFVELRSASHLPLRKPT